MHPINYDALKNAESAKAQTSANQYLSNPGTAPRATRRGIAKLLALVILGFVILAIMPGSLKIVVVILGVGGLYLYAAKYSKKHTQAIQQFVTDNSWRFVSPPPITVPSLSQSGERAMVSGQAVSGTLGSTPFLLYTYTSGAGKYEKDSEVLTLQLSGELPTITLDALANNVLGSNLLNQPKNRGLVEISLEGNFQQSFKVYMEPNQQIDVLTIITPEIMQKMIDDGVFFDIDIVGNSVHIISTYGLIAYPYTQKLLDFGQVLVSSLEAKLRTFNATVRSSENQQGAQAPITSA